MDSEEPQRKQDRPEGTAPAGDAPPSTGKPSPRYTKGVLPKMLGNVRVIDCTQSGRATVLVMHPNPKSSKPPTEKRELEQ